MRLPALLGSLLLLCCAGAAPVHAGVSTAQTIDGPSSDVLELGGTAMAADGTGGVVYRKRVDGRPHIFAAQFSDGRWREPQRVDAGQRFDSSWPAIAAADGGRLVVTWVQEFGPADRMFAATLAPGARRFQAPVPVDLNVGEPTATFPSVAIGRGGTGYVSYWVTEEDPTLPRGFVAGELRVARYSGSLWSGFGVPLNRNPSSPIRRPNAETSPRVAVDATGNGILAWQEPDDEQIDRVWARRLFASSFGIPLQVSPGTWGDRPLRAPASGFALDVAGLGRGAIAFRQEAAPGSALAGPRVMLAGIPETFVDGAAAFAPPRIVDGAPPEGALRVEGVAVGVAPAGGFLAAVASDTATLVVGGDDETVERPQRVDDGASTVSGAPQADLADSGAAVLAWRQSVRGRGSVAVRERRSDGVEETRRVFAARGGQVGDVRLAGSGLGDAIVAFGQGTRELAQIGAAVVDAPPGDFTVATPVDFVRPRGVTLRWDPPLNAIGRLRYTVTVDDDTVAEDVRRTSLPVDPKLLEDGTQIAQVIAVDDAGQETTSAPAELRIDGTAPRVTVRGLRGGRVRVRVRDTRSGVARGRTRIRWGDGRSTKSRARATHSFRRRGRYRLSVRAVDALGNARTVRRRVTVR